MKTRIIIFFSLIALLFLFAWSFGKYNEVRLVFCDVGQGDGMLLQKKNFQMLVDVGSANKKMLGCLEDHVPFWDKKIEVVIISHWDTDHGGALVELDDYYKIGKLFSGVEVDEKFEQFNYAKLLRKDDVVRTEWFEFDILWPYQEFEQSDEELLDDNYYSLVGMLDVMGYKVLLTGDAPMEVEQRLVWRKELGDDIDILKVSHHGSNTGTSEELLEVIKPRMAVIGVGRNSYGHPTKEVIERLEARGVEIKRTDKDGDIVFVLEKQKQ
ncbi:MBL fold metallo-hydrolase [Patescibacteria group bacterium]|nr:MBL fold metallo-hydrolase [Patescibacteria group bacterium]